MGMMKGETAQMALERLENELAHTKLQNRALRNALELSGNGHSEACRNINHHPHPDTKDCKCWQKIKCDALGVASLSYKHRLHCPALSERGWACTCQPIVIESEVDAPKGNYFCLDPKCGWIAMKESRPLSRGIKVRCPVCNGDADYK